MTIGRMLDGLLQRGHEVQLVRPRQHAGTKPRRDSVLQEILVASVPLPRYAGLRMGLPATARCARLGSDGRPRYRARGDRGATGLVCPGRGPTPGHACDLGFPHQLPQLQQALRRRASRAAHRRRICKRFHNRALCTFVPTQQLAAELGRQGYRKLRVVARGVDTDLFNPQRRSAELRASWGAAGRKTRSCCTSVESRRKKTFRCC